MGTEDEYEPGDVNTIDSAPGASDVGAEYEAGDINLSPTASRNQGTEDGVEAEEDGIGNRSHTGTPTAVLTYLARSLASDPDAVVVRADERNGTVRLQLHVAPEDMGRVIGRRGRTAQAIRTLVGVAGAHDGVQTSVDIVDD